LGPPMDVAVWLRSLGLEKYEAAFRENEINERVLPSLTAEDLKELGITALGHRRIFLDALAALRADTGGKTPPADVPSSATSISPQRPRRAPPSDGDVLGPCWLYGPFGAHGA
jgi:hypothetical protein